mgnify:CR=1 FL=1
MSRPFGAITRRDAVSDELGAAASAHPDFFGVLIPGLVEEVKGATIRIGFRSDDPQPERTVSLLVVTRLDIESPHGSQAPGSTGGLRRQDESGGEPPHSKARRAGSIEWDAFPFQCDTESAGFDGIAQRCVAQKGIRLIEVDEAQAIA